LAAGGALVTAESCTGGWIGKACTDLPGSSRWFRGGAIVYDNELKTRLTGVQAATLERHGAVSEATAREMARGALEASRRDDQRRRERRRGPDGGTTDKPVGTVWFGWALRRGESLDITAEHHLLPGDRDDVRRESVALALRGVLQRSVGD
jgi:nicotinamide-nucleotide amidase